MKQLKAYIILFFAFFLFSQNKTMAQHNHSHVDGLRKRLPIVPTYVFNKDSLAGFNEAIILNEVEKEHFKDADIKRVSYLLKRKFIDEKYFIGRYAFQKTNANREVNGGVPTTQAIDCATENFDFENGTGSGWALTGNTQIVSSGTDPYGSFPFVYPGAGSYSLRISDDVSPAGDFGQAIKTIAVPANGKTLFTFHFAMSLFGYPHDAAAAAKFKVDFFDAANNPLPCPKYECYHSIDADVGVTNFSNTPNPASSYNAAAVGDSPGSNPATTANWNDVTLDLTAFAGQTISARFRIDWCIYTPDWAYCLVDADCPVNDFVPIPVCGGAGSSVCGPANMLSYNWQTPTGGTANTQCITATTAGIYTLSFVPANVQCSAAPTFTYAFDVKATPIADFNYTYTPCQSSLSVPFADNSALNGGTAISSYTWSWGDGTTNGSAANETHPFAIEGVQSVTLLVTNGTCSDEVVKTITITTKPTANFTTNDVCQGLATNFTDVSTTPISAITTWDWDFTNDGITDATIQNPTFTYPSSGTFTAELTVTTANGCSHSFTKPVSVFGHAIPNFTANPVCFGSVMSFTNNINVTTNANAGTVSNWVWNFGDATTANTQNPTHTYTDPANNTTNTAYQVSYTVTTSNGCSDNITKPVTVYSNPLASFVSTEVCFNQPTNLLSSANGNGNAITGHAWDFTGDNMADINGPNTLNYTMPLVGNNNVNYTVTTTPIAGLTCKTATTQIVITSALPQAAFTFVNNCINAQPNTFDGSTSSVSSGIINDYAWNFGDSQTDNSPLATTTHIYNLATLYNVALTVTSDKGCTHTVTHQIEVYAIPIANITSASKVCLGSATTFTANMLPNSGNVVQWQWDVNNTLATIEVTGQQGSHNFTSEGLHVLNVIATTNHGCVETITRNVYVNYIPQPEFIVDDPEGCPLPHCVTFTDQTPAITGPTQITQWTWNFGNGTTQTASNNGNQNTCYTNTSSSQLALYAVSLTTKTDSGCVATNNKPGFITVYPTPIAQYTVVPEFGNVVVPLVHFVNQSVDYNQVNWNFGDGTTNTITINPNHDYSTLTSNDYYTSLVVTNQYGCSDTAKVPVNIAPEFVFYIPNAFTPNGDGINDGFVGTGIGIVKYEMWIYERWGTNVYYTDDIAKPWMGKVIGRSEEAPQDVYSWKVELKDIFGKKHNYVGHVTLLK